MREDVDALEQAGASLLVELELLRHGLDILLDEPVS
jgi:hypothetical protein